MLFNHADICIIQLATCYQTQLRAARHDRADLAGEVEPDAEALLEKLVNPEERAALVLEGPEVEQGELHCDDACADESGPGGAELGAEAEAETIEERAAQNGLEKVVGEAHPTEEAYLRESLHEACNLVPEKDECRHYHRKDAEVVHRLEDLRPCTEIHVRSGDRGRCSGRNALARQLPPRAYRRG